MYSLYLLWRYRKYYYNIILILKIYYILQKIKKTYTISTQMVDDWVWIHKY